MLGEMAVDRRQPVECLGPKVQPGLDSRVRRLDSALLPCEQDPRFDDRRRAESFWHLFEKDQDEVCGVVDGVIASFKVKLLAELTLNTKYSFQAGDAVAFAQRGEDAAF